MKYRIAILLLLITVSLYAQDTLVYEDVFDDSSEYSFDTTNYGDDAIAPDQLVATREYRSDTLQVKAFDSLKWRKIVGQTDFAEKEKEREPEQPVDSSFDMPWNSFILKVISYMAIIAIGVMIIYYLIRNTRFSRTIRNADRPSDPDLPMENIDEFDMQRLVDDALRGGALALAIRYYYLGLLKKLNSAGKIVWKKDKTNIDYLTELFTSGYYYKEVRSLTLAYETIWYGERAVSRIQYDQLISDFEEIHRKVGEGKTDERN